MNPKAVEVVARQRYDQLAADARGDQLIAQTERGSDSVAGAFPSNAARSALLARPRFAAAIRRFHSPAREASGGRF